MRATIRDTIIYFDVEGMGLVPDGAMMRERPVAMVVHGGPGSDHSGFKPAYSPLATRMQLIYFDHRGHGRSARGDAAKYTLDESVEDMEALRRHLGTGPIVSIGTSYGGMVAMAHAARYPAGVSHLILIVTAAHNGFITRAKQYLRKCGTPEQQAAFEKLSTGALTTIEAMRRYYAVTGPLYSVRYDAEAPESSHERSIPSPEAQNRGWSPGGFLHSFDLRPELKNIASPTLILAGRHDWICPPEFSEEIHRLIPGSDLRIFEKSSHQIRVDEPEALIDAIAGFIAHDACRTAG
ncbi:MAG: alpha/beta fold hydrolase [Proteobacteria bacterium]|nr:alpha/beta fold hydrolase [Pseudomonadota bacterium]MBI3497042.1 alpha/beta fold hydrolase [Pseudomonadota bacterium]